MASRGPTFSFLVCTVQSRVFNGSSSDSHQTSTGPRSRLLFIFVTHKLHLWPPGGHLAFSSVRSNPIFFRLISGIGWIPIHCYYSLVLGGHDLKDKGGTWPISVAYVVRVVQGYTIISQSNQTLLVWVTFGTVVYFASIHCHIILLLCTCRLNDLPTGKQHD